MSPPPPPSAGDGGGDGGGEEAKAAGFVVFSGIAMSIVKALAFKPPQPHSPPSPSPSPYPSPSPSPQEKLVVEEGLRVKAPKSQVVEIARGDTLWGLSRRYGVSIDSIREVNGITGDTIYAGKKLIIP
uniref:LysM domain-containing protein n=1 Tax=Ananas comosus var. bracteatus TaxID=296719 RepID=A0A6V7QJD5_ANACO|nr:unnamed protein product [Ananas comosus var. bracteatus]